MDSRVSEKEASRPLRRSARHSSGNVKALSYEPTPRGPLKRTRKRTENQVPAAAVNGSRDVEDGSEDEAESPSKKSRLETGGAAGGSGDENDMESVGDLEENEDQEMDSTHGTEQSEICQAESPSKKSRLETGGAAGGSGDENDMESVGDLEENEDQEMDSTHGTEQSEICQGPLGDVNLFPRVVLGERCIRSHAVNEDADWMKTRVKPSPKGAVAPTNTASHIRPPANRHDMLISKVPSMADNKKTMEAKDRRTGIPSVNHYVPSLYPVSAKPCTTRQRVNNIPTEKETVKLKRQGIKKTSVTKTSSGYSCRGVIWCLCRLILLVLFCSAVLLAYKRKKTADGGKYSSAAVKPEMFADQLSLLEAQFPNQRPALWSRSKIHLEKHLQTAQPTEPVSLIFTAGQRAERTLHCLARGLASSFSAALNVSVLHIDGASKASQDSDEVKLDIDSQLRAAFDGDKPVAVIHRFEELPPGSTLIFYRYCDHENAAYKRVFLLFTVLLPQDEVKVDQSLKEVEELVQDYLKERLVDSSSGIAFNEMDIDKFGGLWSRISHLILPVVFEREVEQRGC